MSEKKETIERVNRIWDAFVNDNPKMVAPMLKGMPKKAAPYFLKFLKKNSYGYVDNDLRYCTSVLNLMGVSTEDAKVFFESEVDGKYSTY